MGGNGDFPWLLASNNNTDNLVSAGFQNAAVTGALSGIQSSITSGFGDVQNSLCSGFAGVNAGIANGFAQAEIAENARQMANMQQMFGLQSQFSDCLKKIIRKAKDNLVFTKYTVGSCAA